MSDNVLDRVANLLDRLACDVTCVVAANAMPDELRREAQALRELRADTRTRRALLREIERLRGESVMDDDDPEVIAPPDPGVMERSS